MNRLFSKKSAAAIAILALLCMYALVNTPGFVNAATIKQSNIFISGGGSLTLVWKSGKSQTFASDSYASLSGLYSVSFGPDHGWHVDTILFDGSSQGILNDDGFTLVNVRVKSTISVVFLVNGGVDDVAAGSNIEAYPDPLVSLIFQDVLTPGFVYAHTIAYAYLQPPNATSESWDIETNASFVENVTVVLVLSIANLNGSDPALLRLVSTEQHLAKADVNSDGKIDGTDVSIVANANPSAIGDPKYDLRLDMNNDGAIDDLDVNIVNNYIGQLVWQDITLQVIVIGGLVYVYGVTSHFSIFGVS